ncbi:MAG TPA: hypothetical protein VK210_10000 [Terriglobia bacterium]|nr:hypothetical protein [Terriglobia bacterium]
MKEKIRRFLSSGIGNDISAAELVRECGRRLTDRGLWDKFQERFRRPIFLFLLRTMNERHVSDPTGDLASDLGQDFYVKLVQNDGRLLRDFRGNSEFSALAFLARVAISVVSDFHRRQYAAKRQQGQVISIETARETENQLSTSVDLDVGTILSWIDLERLVALDADQKHASRNIIILKLRYIDGLTIGEIAKFPGFGLTEAGIDTVLRRLKARLQEGRG